MKLPYAVVGFVGLGAGVLLGLAIAALSSGSIETLKIERDKLAADNQRLSSELATAQRAAITSTAAQPVVGAADSWGPCESLRTHLGPGSRFAEFAAALKASGAWQDDAWWGVGLCNLDPQPQLSLFAPGPGKINIEAIVGTNYALPPGLMVTLVFSANAEDRIGEREAAKNLHQRILAVGEALKLDAEESKRLQRFAVRVPVPYEGNIEDLTQRMMQFALGMPERAQKQFTQCLKAIDQSEKIDFQFPVIGFTLSKRVVVDLVFAATELPLMWKGVEYQKFGPHWSVVFSSAELREWSAPIVAEKIGPQTVLCWPRLTTAEVDALR